MKKKKFNDSLSHFSFLDLDHTDVETPLSNRQGTSPLLN